MPDDEGLSDVMDTAKQEKRNRLWAIGSLAFLLVVVSAHVATIWGAFATGSLVIGLMWIYLALPLFIPGFVIGLCLLWPGLGGKPLYRAARIVLGIAAVALPFYEWYLLTTLRSGYLGG